MHIKKKKKVLADGVEIGLEVISFKKRTLFDSHEKSYKQALKGRYNHKKQEKEN